MDKIAKKYFFFALFISFLVKLCLCYSNELRSKFDQTHEVKFVKCF